VLTPRRGLQCVFDKQDIYFGVVSQMYLEIFFCPFSVHGSPLYRAWCVVYCLHTVARDACDRGLFVCSIEAAGEAAGCLDVVDRYHAHGSNDTTLTQRERTAAFVGYRVKGVDPFNAFILALVPLCD